MKVSILKRLEAAEKSVGTNKAPLSMVISFEAETNNYRVVEQFEGTPQKPGKHKITYKDSLEEVVVSSDFHGVILIDLMAFGEPEGGLYSVNADKVRKKAKLEKNSSFSFKVSGELEELKQGFIIEEL